MDLETLQRHFDGHHETVKDLIVKSNEAIGTQDGRLTNIEQMLARRGSGGHLGSGATETMGETVIKSNALKAFVENGYRGTQRLEIKAVSTVTSGAGQAGALIAPDRQPEIIALPHRPLTIRQLIAPGQTVSNLIYFMKQTVRTNNAAPVAEGALKPQSDIKFDASTAAVKTVAHWIPVTRQAFDDAPALQGMIDTDLRFGLEEVEENQLLYGDGTGENLYGVGTGATTYSAPFAITGETPIDRVCMGAAQAQLASLLPSEAIVLHPLDWLKIRLTKDGMGNYIAGGPTAPQPRYLWGMLLVVTPAQMQATFLVGNFSQSAQIFDRMTTEVLISSEASYPTTGGAVVHSFVQNQLVIRAEKRLALAVKRSQGLVVGTLP